MACGVHLGILLICLIEAEHVLCLWVTQAQGQNSNTNVGFSQKGSGFGGSDLQNQLRQVSGSHGSAQSSSFNTEVSSGYSQRFPSSGNTQGVSEAARRGYALVRFMPSNSKSKPNRPKTRLSHENVQKRPNDFGLSTNIASGNSISRYRQSPLSGERTWPVQQGTPSTSNYQSLREIYAFKPASHQSAAQKASSLSSTGAAEPHRIPARTKTSASASATRVSSHRSSEASKPSHFPSLQNEVTRNNPSQTEAGNQYPSKLFDQGPYKPASASHMASSLQSYSRSLPVSNKHSAPAGFNPSSGNTLTSYTSTEQVPSSMRSLQTSWNSRNSAQGARNLPASRTKSVGISDQRFPLTRIYNIPQRFGGYAIIRLKKTADQKEVSVGQQPPYVVPQQPYVVPQQPYVVPQPPYVVPQPPYVVPQPPYVVPQPTSAQQQAYVVPQRPSASYKTRVQSVHPVARWLRIPSFMGK
ncbi:protein transport protein sec31-like isoform X2 [Anarrhichthys ocellatus]|uniref:protein transport protein sec31-like isoform X2 n=1 Tax=Anarrhichthys ocellatus TaxID=433405 RepID=UPI0012EE1669|nr:protein transport protein sec31-like isoform X2 [Anarrhichthys ocellatus]